MAKKTMSVSEEEAALVGLAIRHGVFTEEAGFAFLGAIMNKDPQGALVALRRAEVALGRAVEPKTCPTCG